MTYEQFKQEFETYAEEAVTFAQPPKGVDPADMWQLGILGEMGEVAEIVKKRVRKGEWPSVQEKDFRAELGDVLWYIVNFAQDLEFDMNAFKVYHSLQNNGVLFSSLTTFNEYASRVVRFQSLNPRIEAYSFVFSTFCKEETEDFFCLMMQENLEKLRVRKKADTLTRNEDKR